MKRVLVCGVLALFSACAQAQHGTSGAPPELNFSGAPGKDDLGENTAFSKSVAARYRNAVALDTARAEAASLGFQCDAENSGDPSEPVDTCTKASMNPDTACADAFILDLYKTNDAGMVRVEGRHVRRCMGALVDDES